MPTWVLWFGVIIPLTCAAISLGIAAYSVYDWYRRRRG